MPIRIPLGITGALMGLEELVAQRKAEKAAALALEEKRQQQQFENNIKLRQQGSTEESARMRSVLDMERLGAQSTQNRLQRELDTTREERLSTQPVEINGALVEPRTGRIITTVPRQIQANPVMRINPRTGTLEKIGEAPQGSHFVNEPGSDQNARPYYTVVPRFDDQGRPIGGVRIEGRTGKVSAIDPSEFGGGQLKPPPGPLGPQSITNETASDQLQRLAQLFKPDFVGPVVGRAHAIGQQVPGITSPEGFDDFAAATAAFRNSVIKAITGAQMSEPEARRIRQQIPELHDKPEVWQAKMRQTAQNLTDLENRIKNPRGSTPPPSVPPDADVIDWQDWLKGNR